MTSDATSMESSIGPLDFIIRRQGWVSIAIGLGVIAVVSYFRIGSNLDTKMAVFISFFAVLYTSFFYMPIIGANRTGITKFKFYKANKSYRWENIIDADIEKNESWFATQDSPKTLLVLTLENTGEIKIGIDWENVDCLLDLVQNQVLEHRISPRLKSLLETGEVPLNA